MPEAILSKGAKVCETAENVLGECPNLCSELRQNCIGFLSSKKGHNWPPKAKGNERRQRQKMVLALIRVGGGEIYGQNGRDANAN